MQARIHSCLLFLNWEKHPRKAQNALNSLKQGIESLQGSSTHHLDHWVYLLLNDPL